MTYSHVVTILVPEDYFFKLSSRTLVKIQSMTSLKFSKFLTIEFSRSV